MPICRECQGTGQVEVKNEIMKRCPDCDATKRLPDGTECKRCDQWGEIGTGRFESAGNKLCRTCMGSGKVSEGSLTIWFLVRAVPASLLLLGGGLAVIWAAWNFVAIPWLTGLLTIVTFSLWGGVMAYFTGQMPDLGEISATNWFLIRAIPTTLVALAVGGAVTWLVWFYSQNIPVVTILALAGFGVWGAFMYYFISHLPE